MKTQTISKIENGSILPNLATLAALAEGLEVGLVDLLDGGAEGRPLLSSEDEQWLRLVRRLEPQRAKLAFKLVEVLLRDQSA